MLDEGTHAATVGQKYLLLHQMGEVVLNLAVLGFLLCLLSFAKPRESTYREMVFNLTDQAGRHLIRMDLSQGAMWSCKHVTGCNCDA